jgi:hypothetical protein
LYNDASVQREKKLQRMAVTLPDQQVSPTRILERSSQLYLRHKTDVFKEIFSLLDSNKDNLITAEAITITGLPLEIVNILEPLFEELEKIEEGIDQHEFVEAIDRLYGVSCHSVVNLYVDSGLEFEKQAHVDFQRAYTSSAST